MAEACASMLYYMCFFEKQEGPWLPGTLTSRDLSCVSEPGLNWECKTGRALLAGGRGGGEEQHGQRHQGRMSLLRAEDGMETSLIGAGSSCRGDGGGCDWIAKVGPDLEGFECPTKEYFN